MSDHSGWAIELRVTRYQVVDGKTEREYHESHYMGSLTEAAAHELYRRANAQIEPALAGSSPAHVHDPRADYGDPAGPYPPKAGSSPAPAPVPEDCELIGTMVYNRETGEQHFEPASPAPEPETTTEDQDQARSPDLTALTAGAAALRAPAYPLATFSEADIRDLFEILRYAQRDPQRLTGVLKLLKTDEDHARVAPAERVKK